METKVCTRCHAEKLLDDFPLKYDCSGKRRSICKKCNNIRSRQRKRHTKDVEHFERDSTWFLGIEVAERALSKFFDVIERMPYDTSGYDFICGKGFKIDVKAACLTSNEPGHTPNRWQFKIRKNKIADYFILLGFDNREHLNPMHVWLVPSDQINDKSKVSITNTPKVLSKWSKHERQLDRVLCCCDAMKAYS
jgi:hypothetical protein